MTTAMTHLFFFLNAPGFCVNVRRRLHISTRPFSSILDTLTSYHHRWLLVRHGWRVRFISEMWTGLSVLSKRLTAAINFSIRTTWHGNFIHSSLNSRTKPAMISLWQLGCQSRGHFFLLRRHLTPVSAWINGFLQSTDDNLNLVHINLIVSLSVQLEPLDELGIVASDHVVISNELSWLGQALRQDFCSDPWILISIEVL